MEENVLLDKKSLRTITKPNPDWDELAKDCVCLANAYGGKLIFGVEDSDKLPPSGQIIPPDLPQILQKQIQNRTVNVSVVPQVLTAENSSEYIELLVKRNESSIASTTNGKYYIRIDKSCKPILPDELLRLIADKGAFIWETQTNLKIIKSDYDKSKFDNFISDIKSSERVSLFIKNKTPAEILEHYFFVSGDYLTNLGILWIGKREHRAKLLFTPIVQYIKYDENDKKTHKIIYDDYSKNPKELLYSILNEIPDWKEGIEIEDGIFRKKIYNYEEPVIRELVVNALVHKPYTTRGDIFINIFPDRMEIRNPGLLPLGVTPQNILHKSVQRNPHLSKIFWDLKLMEKEGSGYDKMYEILLSHGKPLPELHEENDSVNVIIRKRITNYEIVKFIENINSAFQLRPKELISIGLIAQHNSLNAIEFADILGLKDKKSIRVWLGRIIEFGLVNQKGKTKGTTYSIEPSVLKKHDFKGKTNLKDIHSHRLEALIIEDLERFGKSSISEIHKRIGSEIPIRKLRHQLGFLLQKDIVFKEGIKKSTRYFIDK